MRRFTSFVGDFGGSKEKCTINLYLLCGGALNLILAFAPGAYFTSSAFR